MNYIAARLLTVVPTPWFVWAHNFFFFKVPILTFLHPPLLLPPHLRPICSLSPSDSLSSYLTHLFRFLHIWENKPREPTWFLFLRSSLCLYNPSFLTNSLPFPRCPLTTSESNFCVKKQIGLWTLRVSKTGNYLKTSRCFNTIYWGDNSVVPTFWGFVTPIL